MQRRDDPEVAAAFDFVSAYQDELEAGRSHTLAEWLARHPGHEAAIAREWLALREQQAHAGPEPAGDERRVGPYRVLSELGRGGQGAVFLAEDTRIARRVALKVLGSHFDSVSEERRRRFRREAEVIARLEHPGICTIHEADIDGPMPYLAMRFVEGRTLAHRLAEEQPGAGAPRTALGIRERLLYFERAARALHAAHEAGVLHRDIKPGNLMVTPEGLPVLLDFGLAREESTQEVTALTQPGDVFGTPAYMAPEQLELSSSEIDRRADVYSLGAALYETLTLQRPFEAGSRAELYMAIARQPLPDPRRLNPALSADVAVVLATALEKDRARRYPSALELAEDLRRIREYETIHARPAGLGLRLARWTRRNPVLAATVVALSIGLSVALWALAGERAALRVALGRHLGTRCTALIPQDPSAALVLGIQACELAPNYITRAALLEALGACRLEQELRCGDATASDMALSADGRAIAVAFRAARTPPHPSCVRVFDLAQRGRFVECQGEGPEFTGVVCAGERILGSASDGRLRAWDVRSGALAGELDLAGPLLALERSHDGTRALAAGKDFVALVALADLRLLRKCDIPDLGSARPRFSTDDRWFYAAAGATLQRFDAHSGAGPESCTLADAIRGFDCEPGGERVLCRIANGVQFVAGLRAGEAQRLESGPAVEFVCFSPDGARAVVSTAQGASVLDSGRLRPIPVTVRVPYAAFSPDGLHLATASYDQCLRIWSVPDLELEQVLRGPYRPQELGWSADGARLWMRNVGTGGTSWNVGKLPDVFELESEGSAVRELRVAPGSEIAEGVCADGRVRRWSLASGACLESTPADDSAPAPPAVEIQHAGAKLSVTGSEEGILSARRAGEAQPVWERLVRAKKKEEEVPQPLRPLCAARDGSEFCVAAGSDWIIRFAAQDGAELERFQRPFNLRSVSYSPAGGQLLLVGAPGGGAFRLLAFEPRGKSSIAALEINHLDDIAVGSFSPDGELLATASRDGVCYVRDPRGGLPITQARLESAPLCIAWTGGSGRWSLVIGCESGALVLPVDPLPAARARVPRALTDSEVETERHLAEPLEYDR